jgi:hypothetical protein
MPDIRLTLASAALVILALCGCGPGRTTFAVHPSAAPAFDRAGSDPKAVEIADRVIAAAGGQDKWAAAKQIRWSEAVASGDPGKPPVTLDEAWDRWNGRHHLVLHTAAGDIIVMRGLYDGHGAAFGGGEGGMQKLTKQETDHAIADARERWEFDATTLLIPFLLESPGVKLGMVGERPGEAGQPALDELKMSFDPKDQTRTLTYYVLVDRSTNQIQRLEIVKAGDPDTKRVGYKLASWVEVGGLKLPTVFQNVAFAGAVITYSSITVSGEPDERLYVPVAH